MIAAISGVGGVGYVQSLSGLYGRAGAQALSRQETGMRLQLSGEGTLPVQPVERVRPLGAPIAHTSAGVDLEQRVRQGQFMEPAELAVRLRLQGAEDAADAAEAGNALQGTQEILREGECQTCAERKYQDGSDDAGVSFQTAAHIAPEAAASTVRGHELEHVSRNRAKAQREDREIVSQSVTLHTAICPECGRIYVSGGTTRTTTAAKSEPLTAEREDGGLSLLV